MYRLVFPPTPECRINGYCEDPSVPFFCASLRSMEWLIPAKQYSVFPWTIPHRSVVGRDIFDHTDFPPLLLILTSARAFLFLWDLTLKALHFVLVLDPTFFVYILWLFVYIICIVLKRCALYFIELTALNRICHLFLLVVVKVNWYFIYKPFHTLTLQHYIFLDRYYTTLNVLDNLT